jgi:hypothetical protein
MSTNALDRLDGQVRPRQAATTQATAVEQSRAVSEVAAAVQVAQACPRNIDVAMEEMRRSCGVRGLAERAFYSVPNRGSGPTVHLARELARIFGNLQYGVHELSRDDAAGMSEIQAYAWDVQTNTRAVRTFQVPHARMTRGGKRQELTDLGDIYNNNQNVGARAVRECIYGILPPWFVEEAKDACSATLKDDPTPLADRIATAVKAFASIGIDVARLEKRTGKPSTKWDENDVAQLGILYRTIQRGEVQVDEALPPEAAVTAADITGGASELFDTVPDGGTGSA